MYKTSEFKDFSKSAPSRLAQMIDNPFRNFSASKMSQAVKPMTVVEYTDLLGKLHRIPVRNRTEMKKAQLFLSILKAETAKVKDIIAQYPMKYGQVPKRFMAELRAELKAIGFDSKMANRLAGY
jgi:hypothetical protein